MKPIQLKYDIVAAGRMCGIAQPRDYQGAEVVIKAAPKDLYLPGTVPVASSAPAPREGFMAYLERQARENHKPKEPDIEKCETCDGTGESFEMVCYGDAPCERACKCPDCDGNGFIDPNPVTIADKLIEKTAEQLGDGWIAWGGGDGAVPLGDLFDVKARDGSIWTKQKLSDYYWRHSGSQLDIIAYRPSKPEQTEGRWVPIGENEGLVEGKVYKHKAISGKTYFSLYANAEWKSNTDSVRDATVMSCRSSCAYDGMVTHYWSIPEL